MQNKRRLRESDGNDESRGQWDTGSDTVNILKMIQTRTNTI